MKLPVTARHRRSLRRGVAVTAAVAVAVGVALSAAPADAITRSGHLVGTVDSVSAGVGTVTVAGWDYDTTGSSRSIQAEVTVGGAVAGVLPAGGARADVDRVMRVSGAHGYSGTVATTKSGKQTVCVIGLGIARGATATLGCTTTTIASPNPTGSFDSVSAAPGSVSVSGWSYDPNDTAASNAVRVSVGGTTIGTLSADDVRNDVDSAKRITGAHGFSGTIATTATGAQRVCLTAVNTGAGADTSIGCKTVALPSPNPVGTFDSATGGVGTVAVRGWTYDPNDPSASNAVSVAVGGNTVGTLQATGLRADVDAVKHVTGDHGYDGTVTTSLTGSQSVCITAINSGAGQDVSLGCRTVAIGGAPAVASSGGTSSSGGSGSGSGGSGSSSGSSSADPSGQAMPVGDVTSNGRTWKQVYSQDFTTNAPVGSFLAKYPDIAAYNGYNDTSGQGLYAPAKVLSASNGMLDFDLHSENGQPLVSSISPGNYMSFTTGRVSIRYKTTAAAGYKFVGILWPKDDNWNEGEIDWPEADLGGTPRPASAIPGTLGQGTGGAPSFAPGRQIFANSDTTGWHTATTEWDHGIVRFYWDGQLLTSVTNAVPTTPFRVALQAETWIGEGAVPTSSVGHVDIDWISIWE